MQFIDGRGYAYCVYCTTFRFPTQSQDSADRVKPLDDHSEISCPICRSGLSKGSVEGMVVDWCETCRGLLLPNDKFAEIIKLRRAEYGGPPDKPIPLNPDNMNRRINCPACQKPMDVHPYYGPGAVVIDSCPQCRIIWLDHGELATMERAPGHR